MIQLTKTIGNRKEIVREVALGGETPHKKICRSKGTNQEGVRSARPTDLCFSICRFSQMVFIPRAQLHATISFLFPIVFGINLIHFFEEGRCSRKFDRLFRCVDLLSRHLTEAKGMGNVSKSATLLVTESVNSAPVHTFRCQKRLSSPT